MPTPDPATGLAILAGGQARRLGGGDKTLHRIGGQTMLEGLIDRLSPSAAPLIVNANGDPARFGQPRPPIVPDDLPGHPGPLAGVLAALDWMAAHAPAVSWVVTVPGDVPFPPRDLVARLHAARRRDGTPLACAASGPWTHPTIALWPVSIRAALRTALVDQGIRQVNAFTAAHGRALAYWDTEPVDPFFNVNTPEDLAEANRLAARYPEL